MKKRVLSTLLCLIMVLALLPTAALAGTSKHYTDREAATADSGTWQNGEAIIIGKQPYIYSGDVSNSGISYDLLIESFIVFKAGDGIVLWDPTKDSGADHITGGTLTLYNATIVTDSIESTVTLPSVPVKLMLEGENRIENKQNNKLGGNKTSCVEPSVALEFAGSGSLDLIAEHGTGIYIVKLSDVIITGGNININAEKGVDWNTSSYDNTTNMAYRQSGGSVKITASGDEAIDTKEFELSGGTLEIKGESAGVAIAVKLGATVSGGNLKIAGKYQIGFFAYEQMYYNGITAGNTGIHFTGGITDITLGDASAAFNSGYSKTFAADVTGDNPPNENPPAHRIIIGPNMRITKGGNVVWSEWIEQPDGGEGNTRIWNAIDTIANDKVVINANTGFPNGASSRVLIEPKPNSAYNYTPSPATVYNDPVPSNSTVWLTGSGLSGDDLLITERNPSGSEYRALLKLADSSDVFKSYNIYLRSGKKSTGYAMNLTFNLNARYAGQDFTLVHQKADSTYEYFYDTADANGDLTFGPLYELSPFMLVKGTLTAGAVDIPQTGDCTQSALWVGGALIGLLMLCAAAYAIRRKRA